MRVLVLPITYLCFYYTLLQDLLSIKNHFSLSLIIHKVFLVFVVLFPLSLVWLPYFFHFTFFLVTFHNVFHPFQDDRLVSSSVWVNNILCPYNRFITRGIHMQSILSEKICISVFFKVLLYFLLNTIISAFTHGDTIRSCSWGALIKQYMCDYCSLQSLWYVKGYFLRHFSLYHFFLSKNIFLHKFTNLFISCVCDNF
jgi:hypothetical protein